MIIDTGILYAITDRDDLHHQQARDVFDEREEKIVPGPVVVETDWRVLSHLGVDAEIAFLQGLSTRAFEIEEPTSSDRERAATLVAQYRDARVGYVDAVVMAMAERLGERRIATLDRRDFSLVRPRHVEAFEIIP